MTADMKREIRMASEKKMKIIESKIDDIIELLKNQFGFKHISWSFSEDGYDVNIGITYNGVDWKVLMVDIGDRETLKELFANALFKNKWDYEYGLHTNTIIVKELIKQFVLDDCGYYLHEDMLFKADFSSEGEEIPGEYIIDLSEIYGVSYLTEDDELTVLKLTSNDGTYEINQDGYTFTQKQTA